MAMSDPLSWLDEDAAGRAEKGLARSLTPLGTAGPGRVVAGGRTLANFASNDYLGLAADPRVVAAGCRAAEQFGWGAGASALVTGWREPHEALAEDLARFEGVESVALFPTGYAANLGAVASLAGKGDAVYLDRLNHASLVDGARLSGASLRVYPHADADMLASTLRRDQGRYRRTLIATDGVFGMDGDLAPLSDLAEIARRFSAMLLVDEAHGTGVFGPDGRGASSELGVADRVHARVGTLSKALGSLGGFVAGSRRLVDHLVNSARTLIYSTALPPAAAAAAREALAISRAEPWRRERARMLGDRLRSGLSNAGVEIVSSTGPIVPVMVGEPERALALAGCLRERGFLAPAIRPPTVPRGTSRIRLTATAATKEDEVDSLVRAIAGSL
jgi:8-amino-7-oxononanoate synthase